MKKVFYYVLVFFTGILLTIILSNFFGTSLKLTSQQFCLGGIFFICFLIVVFITVSGLNSVKTNKAALNFPDGTIRAIIALLAIIFFVLLSVVFYFVQVPAGADLSKQILTILGTLVTAVCSFYFGSKATEQGNKIAQETFKIQADASNPSPATNVPQDIVEQAINANKASWLGQYNCTDIIAGKKTSGGNIQNINCIIFLVTTKSDNPAKSVIPPVIPYTSDGVNYIIPTDVRTQESGTVTDDASMDALMRAAIKENYSNWKAQYPNIIGCSVGIKKTAGALVPLKCLVFKVNGKVSASTLGQSATIPSAIVYHGVSIPTDVIGTDQVTALAITQPGDNFVPARLGTSVSRKNSEEFGTASLKVRIPRPGGVFDSFLLSCFHVLYPEKISPELFDANLQQSVNSSGSDQAIAISIPAAPYLTENPGSAVVLQGFVRRGIISPMMDAAIAQIDPAQLDQKAFDNTLVLGEADIDTLSIGQSLDVYGCVSGKQNGVLTDLRSERTDVLLSNSQETFSYTFNQLIEVAVPCQPGDSGAPVLTRNGLLVGIITAGNGSHSYILPFSYIKNTLSIQL